MTGYGAKYFSVITNVKAKMMLEQRRRRIRGCVHPRSSDTFKSNPRRRQPTAPTNVIDPQISIRRSLSRSVRFWISSGSLMLTFAATSTKLKISMGAWGGKEKGNGLNTVGSTFQATRCPNLHVKSGSPDEKKKIIVYL